MNVKFLNATSPMFWFWMSACLIPIIIHLIFRRRYQHIHWAAMKFLLAAYKKTKTTLLIEHILLLLLRIFIVMLLVFLFARPVSPSTQTSSGKKETHQHIIVLDTSYSMGLRQGRATSFGKAKKQVEIILRGANENDTISLITMNKSPELMLDYERIVYPAKANSQKKDIRDTDVFKKITKIKLTHLSDDVEGTVIGLLKEQVKKENVLNNKHIYIISDFQKKSWEKAFQNTAFMTAMKEATKEVAETVLVDVGGEQKDNLAIVELKISSGTASPKTPTHFIVSIKNFGTNDANDLTVRFHVNGVDQESKQVSVGADEQEDLVFTHTFEKAGTHYVSAEIEQKVDKGSKVDQLFINNKRYLCIKTLEKIEALIVDGEPKSGKFANETDYIMAALGNSPNSLIKSKKVDMIPPNMQFSSFDVIVFANFQSFAKHDRYRELEEFIKNGGGVLFWLGRNIDPDHYNEEFYNDITRILPGKIVGSAIGKAGNDIEKTLFTLQTIDKKHPVWNYFQQNPRLIKDIYKCLTHKFFPIKVDPIELKQDKVSILATYDVPSQYPAFLERKLGYGKVLLVPTTADREWNNYHSDQFGHIFVIMIHEFIQYLGSNSTHSMNLEVSDIFLKKYDYYITEGKVINLQNRKRGDLQASITNLNNKIWQVSYRDTDRPGVYALKINSPFHQKDAKQDKSTWKKDYFSVNVNEEEGDVKTMERTVLLDRCKPFSVKYTKNLQKDAIVKETHAKIEYAGNVLAALFALLAIETFLAMWFGRYSK